MWSSRLVDVVVGASSLVFCLGFSLDLKVLVALRVFLRYG